ncbi:NVEALA domain-containing protein [Duncaniella freteri]|uniref:NVEALA domain-containing protein n=2 Tax=Duncaniella freteri TaxID=2530391 RepID=UPI00136F0EA6|nr:hypothetical protein [Alistipes sp. Z76]NCE67838.1 hypothetical protein [Muribaculaceae bacterium M3]
MKMKKNLLLFVVLTSMLSVFWGFEKSSQSEDLSQLTLDNIEALTSNESMIGLYYWPCSHSGGSQCIMKERYERCSRLYYC